MRIVAGAWRGRRLNTPRGAATRPTSARAREAIFSMLTSELGGFEGLRVADLFAGTGALGLESLSRGAAHCTFVECDRKAIATLRANIAMLAADERTDIFSRKAPQIGRISKPVDLAFLDAPYGAELSSPTLKALATQGWLEVGGIAVVETAAEEPFDPAGLEPISERRFGAARVTMLRLERVYS